MGNNFSNDEIIAPLLASRWARADYNGRLKDAVIKACDNLQQDNRGKPDNDHGYEADVGEEGGEGEG